ncbi:MAG: type II secretion system F family protein [Euryarchaeota archaeon]|nr:type II secretion system F family protein [Euryarchaeota archaeon]
MAGSDSRFTFVRVVEWALLATLSIGLGLAGLGAVAISLVLEPFYGYGVDLCATGLVMVATSVVVSLPVRTLKWGRPDAPPLSDAAQRKYWARLKGVSILLNLLMIISGGAMVVALIVRLGVMDALASAEGVVRIAATLMVAMIGAIAYAHYVSLKIPLERMSPIPIVASVLAGFFATSLTGIAGVLVRRSALEESTVVSFDPLDAPFLLLLGACFASATVIAGRSLPTLLVLFRGDQRYFHGRTYLSEKKSVLVPTLLAFSLLLGIFVAITLLGVGTSDIQKPAQASVLGFFAVAMVVSILTALRLGKSRDELRLYYVPITAETKVGLTVLASSVLFAGLLAVVAAALRTGASLGPLGPERWVDVLSLAVLAGLGPYGFLVGWRHRRIRRIESRFPDFLRDIAASHRGGLTLPHAVAVAAKGDYGVLTKEVATMSNQLSWTVSFDDALERMSRRVKTPLIERTTSLIIEASHSGGSTTDVLLAAAHDAREIKNLENERSSSMGLYTIVIYVTFFVFMVVAALLYGSFVPVLIQSSQSAAEVSQSGFGGLTLSTPSLAEYRDFYFLAATMQGIGNGLVAGLMGSGRLSDGLRHSFIMVASSLAMFAIVL